MELSFSHRLCQIIRRHRKIRRLSLTKLAKLLHKAKSTLSKYENGHAIMDLNTFGEIAEILEIHVSQLICEAESLNMEDPEENHHLSAKATENNRRYMYFYDGRENKLRKSLIFVSPQEAGVSRISLYYMLKQFEAPESCKLYYSGTAERKGDFTIYTFENTNNAVEKMFLIAKEPFQKQGVMGGMIMGISFYTTAPISFKVLISDRPLAENDHLLETLKVSKESIASLRDANGFTICEVTEEFD